MEVITITSRSKDQFNRSLQEIYKKFGYDRIEVLGSGVQTIRQAVTIHAIVLIKDQKPIKHLRTNKEG